MRADLLGHPRGLAYLFATEMWERFSYYGMRALLVLYMVKYLLDPQQDEPCRRPRLIQGDARNVFGPLAPQPLASQIYGFYTGLVYLTPIFGGLLADRVLGQRRTVIVGATLMAIGHFMMAFEQLFLFALGFLILGNGAFKPNISTQVGSLYAPGDRRRDRAFSIFYVGINLGAFLAPLVCGTLGEELGWHYGFAAAGVGMTLSLIIYLCGTPNLPEDAFVKRAPLRQPLDRSDWQSIIALLLLFAPVSLFWATYEQQGNTIALWADQFTDRHFLGGEIPVTWFQAFNPFMIFAFTPFIVAFWRRQGHREHSTIAKLAIGCLLNALAYLVMVAAAWSAGGRKSKLAVAICLFRRHHRWRTLSLANQSLAGHESGSDVLAVDDDGRLAFDQLHRRISRRLSWHLLVEHGQRQFLPDARADLSRSRRRNYASASAAARGTERLIQRQSDILLGQRGRGGT